MQSAFVRQPTPNPHGGQLPPQSTPVSLPFCTLSVHEGATHTPPEQTLSLQSLPVRQPLPSAHGGHEPPQSTSVSFPSFTPSLQVVARHVPPTQVMLVQSPSILQSLPVAQGEQGPPQSTSVSAPSFTPSSQVASAGHEGSPGQSVYLLSESKTLHEATREAPPAMAATASTRARPLRDMFNPLLAPSGWGPPHYRRRGPPLPGQVAAPLPQPGRGGTLRWSARRREGPAGRRSWRQGRGSGGRRAPLLPRPVLHLHTPAVQVLPVWQSVVAAHVWPVKCARLAVNVR